MSSRSSKSKSSRKSSKSLDSITKSGDIKKKSIVTHIFNIVLLLAFYGLILYYLYNLEDETCNCIRDWRHDYMKGYAILSIIIGCIMPFIFKFENTKMFMKFSIVVGILMVVHIYAFYTYIGDLNSTKCSCAVDKQPNINIFLYYYRYVYLALIALAFSMLAIGGFVVYDFYKS